jgi:hypothetical protein
MPLIRCPNCAQRQLVTAQLIGGTVGCTRCERTFLATAQTAAGYVRECTYVAGAIVTGTIVSWMLLRPH